MSDIRDFCCDYCEGTGHEFVFSPCDDDPYYMHETDRPCPHCDGKGYVFEHVWPINMEDLPPPVGEFESPHARDGR